MKAIKRNMVDQILNPKDKKILYCPGCNTEFSGDAGDYWNCPDDHVFTCASCESEMELVTKQTIVRYF